jgi:hypothetical protein
MALFVPPGRFNCKLRWRLAGDPEEMISTLGVESQDTGGPGPDPVDVAHAVYAAWVSAWPGASLHGSWSFVGVDVQGGNDLGEDPGDVVSWDQVTVGTHAYSSVTSNCALLIKKKTALSGRHNSGRMFLPAGYVENDAVSQAGAIVTGSQAIYQLAMNQFYDNLLAETAGVDPIVPTNLRPLLFHGVPAGTPPVEGGRAPTVITSFLVDPVLATQRRRMRH